jgi:hypothetical protein
MGEGCWNRFLSFSKHQALRTSVVKIESCDYLNLVLRKIGPFSDKYIIRKVKNPAMF